MSRTIIEDLEALVKIYKEESKNNISASEEKYEHSEDGYNYHRDDRLKLRAEALLLDRVVAILERIIDNHSSKQGVTEDSE